MGKRLLKFCGLVGLSAGVAHYTPVFVSTALFLLILIYYYRSKGEESFWLSFFLIIQDGILGYFINFENLVYILPGLPAVEAGQLYIGLTLIKARRLKEGGFRPFYFNHLLVLLTYLLFLVVQSYAWGVSMELNVQFRIAKFILPLFLLYSLPRLMDKEKQYWEVLYYLFPMTFTVLFSQVFTILNGISPAQFLGITAETNHLFFVSKDIAYRGFFNDSLLLITLLGAFLTLSTPEKRFSNTYMYLVIISAFLSIFLSATRGWVLGFSAIFFGYLLFVSKINPVQTVKFGFIAILLLAVLYSIPIIKIQTDNAIERLLTLQALAEGDVTAGGTLVRLERRSPLVIKRWSESPLTGIGFSDDFFRYGDRHVGNQNILLHSGIIGALLLLGFFIFFISTLFLRSINLPRGHPKKRALLFFVIFFLGWFVIHSGTSQQFGYYVEPHVGIVEAFFFTFAALTYCNSHERKEFELQSRTMSNRAFVEV